MAVEFIKPHRTAAIRRMDKTTFANIDADVIYPAARTEEHQITAGQLTTFDLWCTDLTDRR